MDIKGDWKKRAVCGLMVLVMALGLLPTSILAADTRSVTDNAIKNGSFEQPAFENKSSPQWAANLVPDWHTTASDQKIEFGSTRKDGTVPHIVGNPNLQDSGCQFAELNADEESTLYQYATTVGGNVYEWGLSHRGRSGIDRMALIIGPKQDFDPAKPSKNGKDQFMRMTDWVRQHALDMGVTVSSMGCTQKITVYSKKFAKNGGFQNDIGDAFSASPSDVYTEKWNVWIIGTSNTAWGNYGTKSSAYAAGNLAYSCRYAVPDGQTKTVFAFCSYSAAGGSTQGNLIDNIHFSLYQTITAAATAGGSGFIIVPTGDKGSEYYEIGSSMRELVVANGSPITVKVVKPKSDDVQFVGAYVTRQTAEGLEQVFIPVTDKGWREEGDTYTYQHHVEEPADIVLVFIKSPTVVYDANGGQEYVYKPDATEPKNTVSFAEDTGRTEYTSHAAQAPAGCKDTWQFQGWLLARSKTLLPAEHTVRYDKNTDTLTFTDNGSASGSAKGGATLIAQWKWRQRFVTASRVKGTDGTASDDFQENTDCGTVEIGGNKGEPVANNPAAKDYFASASERVTVTATAKAGYEFIGWYQQVDGKKYELVSSKPTHSYTVSREGVQTIYARFAPTHTVTYQWASVDAGKCPPKELLNANKISLPEAGTVIDGGTYYISKDFIKGKTTIDGTVAKDGRTVPGKWVFTGWHDGENDGSSGTGGDIVIRETELINVTGDRTLTGFWTFIPEKEHTLTYQFADNTRWSPSGSFELTENYYRDESVTVQSEPARNQTTGEEDVLVTGNVTLYGKWSFDGWKRSDNDSTIAAGNGFNMPGNDLTLTGQWEFTPYTYTVVYDLGNGTTVADPNNENYNYSKLLGSSKLGLNAPTGIPFGASIELMELPAGTEIPDDKYFAGWSLVEPTSDNLDTIQTQDPGDSVGYRKLGITKDKQKVTLYAVYKNKDVATVDFAVNDSNWGDVNTKSGSFTVQNGIVDNKTVFSTAAPRDGYHFVGWYEKKSDGTLTKATDGNGNVITGAALTVTSNMMQAKLDSLTMSREENRTPVLVVRYVAVFARDSFTVQFDGNGNNVTGAMEPQTFHDPDSENQPTKLRKNEFKRPGYVFTGWAESKDGKGRTYADEAPFAEVTTYQGYKIVDGGSITLYAQWEKLPDVTIFYTPEPTSLGTVKLNGTAAKENDTITVQEGTAYEQLNPETGEVQGATAAPGEGSVFVGWYDAQDTERRHLLKDSTTYTPEKDSSGRYQDGSYVALFRLKQYVLHYNANAADAAGTMEGQTFPHGQAYPLKKCAFSREGYRFVGWATEPEGEVKYEDQKSIKLDKEFPNLKDDNEVVTLYAVWQEQSVTLSYESNDAELGSVSSALETVAAVKGTAKGSTAQPKSGARFDGWYSADGTLLSKELTFVPTKKDGTVWQGTTYYAHFSAKRRPSTPSTPAKPDETKPTLAPIPEMLNGEDHYAYLLGYEDGTVRPNGSISRAEVATVLFRLLKDDVRTQNLTKDNAYSDVPDTAWYSTAVSTLSKMGVISGYPDGTFRPNAPITRAEFAAMIARFDETAKSADTPFTDISGHWAENAIGKAYGNGWVEGSSKTLFCPESNLTRAETATLLNRVLHRLPEKESDLLANQIAWPDNPETFWGYLTIQEATNSHEYERKADGVHETQTAKRENRDWSKEFEH